MIETVLALLMFTGFGTMYITKIVEQTAPPITYVDQKRIHAISKIMPFYAEYIKKIAKEETLPYTNIKFIDTNNNPIDKNSYDSKTNTFYFNKSDYDTLLDTNNKCSKVSRSNLDMCQHLDYLFFTNGVENQPGRIINHAAQGLELFCPEITEEQKNDLEKAERYLTHFSKISKLKNVSIRHSTTYEYDADKQNYTVSIDDSCTINKLTRKSNMLPTNVKKAKMYHEFCKLVFRYGCKETFDIRYFFGKPIKELY